VHVMCLGSRTNAEMLGPNLTVHWHKVINLPLLRVPSHHLQVFMKSRKLAKRFNLTVVHSNNYAGAYAYKKLPLIATVHHPAYEEVKHASRLQKPIYRIDTYFERRVAKRADKIIVPSHLVAKLLANHSAYSEKITVLTNGIDLNLFKPVNSSLRNNYIRDKNETLIFFPGGARAKRKGALDLFRALQRIDAPYRCIVTGNMDIDIGWRSELESALVQSGQHERFNFIGSIEFEELPKYYAAADIVVYPSTFEGFGFPILEALACEKPLVCTDTGETPYIIKHGQNGYMVSVGDVSSLSKYLEKLIRSQRDRESLIKNTRESILAYSWESLATEIIRLYLKACSEQA